MPVLDLFPGTGGEPLGQLPTGAVPYMDVEGRGKRPLRFCQTAQDGHTASEQLAYQTLWSHAQRHGRAEISGSSLVDVGLSQLCTLLATDHKNVKRLIGSLRDKLAIEIVRQPDYRLAIPTRYRIFHEGEILERRRNAGLVWVIRTRTVRFVDLETVNRLLTETPTGDSAHGSNSPWVTDCVSARLSQRASSSGSRSTTTPCAKSGTPAGADWPDCTEEEVHWFCRSKEPLIRSGTIDNPVALLIRSVPQFFANGRRRRSTRLPQGAGARAGARTQTPAPGRHDGPRRRGIDRSGDGLGQGNSRGVLTNG